MCKAYQNEEIDTSRSAVPETVNVALAELTGELREGLLALAVGTGLQVLAALMEDNVIAACGPNCRHDPGRTATRHGRGAGSVALAGRRVPVERPRIRATDGSGELAVLTYGDRRVEGAAPGAARRVRSPDDRPLSTSHDQKREDRLPDKPRSVVAARMRRAYHADSALAAEAELCALAAELDKTHPAPRPACARAWPRR